MPAITLDASFWSRGLATLLGTVAGFVFSIALFYISARIKRSSDKKKIIAGLRREVAFNIGLCDVWLKGFADIRLKVAAADTTVFNYFDYGRALRIFVQEALRAGILYDLLSDAELVDLDKGLQFLGQVSEQDINGKVAQWKSGQMAPAQLSQALGFHEFVISETRKAVDKLGAKAASA